MKSFPWLLVMEPYSRVGFKNEGLAREQDHPSQEFLVLIAVVGSHLILLPVLVPQGHQPTFIGMVIMLQGSITVKT